MVEYCCFVVVRGDSVKNIILFAKEAKMAYESYISTNGIDEVSDKIYDLIQNIESLNKEDNNCLNKFIADNTVNELHLADVTYIGALGEKSTFDSLNRMRPFKLSETDARVFEARENSFKFLQVNNTKSIKVYQKAYPKAA